MYLIQSIIRIYQKFCTQSKTSHKEIKVNKDDWFGLIVAFGVVCIVVGIFARIDTAKRSEVFTIELDKKTINVAIVRNKKNENISHMIKKIIQKTKKAHASGKKINKDFGEKMKKEFEKKNPGYYITFWQTRNK